MIIDFLVMTFWVFHIMRNNQDNHNEGGDKDRETEYVCQPIHKDQRYKTIICKYCNSYNSDHRYFSFRFFIMSLAKPNINNVTKP